MNGFAQHWHGWMNVWIGRVGSALDFGGAGFGWGRGNEMITDNTTMAPRGFGSG